MDWETIDTDLAGIDIEDSTYKITTDQSIEPLVASIGAMGLLNPPFLFVKNERQYVVISGFKRVAACQHLKLGRIPARIVNACIPRERLAEIAICENVSQRPLNLVETSRALILLRRHVKEKRAMQRVAMNLGLPDNPSIADKIARICLLPASIQEGVLQGLILLNVALELGSLEENAGILLAELFTYLHFSHSKQREVITSIKEVALREGVTLVSLLQDPQVQSLVSNAELDRAQKVNKLRNYFRSKRYPQMTVFENRFQEQSRRLSLGENIRLKPPAGFESRDYLFTLRIKNLSELDSSIKTLQNVLENPALKNILSRNQK